MPHISRFGFSSIVFLLSPSPPKKQNKLTNSRLECSITIRWFLFNWNCTTHRCDVQNTQRWIYVFQMHFYLNFIIIWKQQFMLVHLNAPINLSNYFLLFHNNLRNSIFIQLFIYLFPTAHCSRFIALGYHFSYYDVQFISLPKSFSGFDWMKLFKCTHFLWFLLLLLLSWFTVRLS